MSQPFAETSELYCKETFVYNYRGQTFLVVLDQVCTHCCRDFGPLLHTGLLQILQKSTPKHDVSTPMLHDWDGALGIVLILLTPNTSSGVYTKKLYFGLICHMTFSHASSGSSRCSLANFRRAWTCAGLSRGTLGVLQDFNP